MQVPCACRSKLVRSSDGQRVVLLLPAHAELCLYGTKTARCIPALLQFMGVRMMRARDQRARRRVLFLLCAAATLGACHAVFSFETAVGDGAPAIAETTATSPDRRVTVKEASAVAADGQPSAIDGTPLPADATPQPADGSPLPEDGAPPPADGAPPPADGQPSGDQWSGFDGRGSDRWVISVDFGSTCDPPCTGSEYCCNTFCVPKNVICL